MGVSLTGIWQAKVVFFIQHYLRQRVLPARGTSELSAIPIDYRTDASASATAKFPAERWRRADDIAPSRSYIEDRAGKSKKTN
jgi:hypothetical protein